MSGKNYNLKRLKINVNDFFHKNYPGYWNFFTPHNDDTVLTFGGFLDSYKHSNKYFFPNKLVFTSVFTRTQWTDPEENYENTNTSFSRINEISGMRNYEATSYYDSLTQTSNYIHGNWVKDNRSLFTKDGKKIYNNCPYLRILVGCQDAPIRGYNAKKATVANSKGFGDWSTMDYMCCGQFVKSYNAAYLALKDRGYQDDNKKGCLFVTSGVGHHIDHFITREAVIAAAYELGKEARCDIVFGEDNPYANYDPKGTTNTMRTLSVRLGGLEMIENQVNTLEKARDFIDNYPSQQKGSAIYVNNIVKGGIDVIENKVYNNREYLFLWRKENFKKATKDPSWHGIYAEDIKNYIPKIYNELPEPDYDTIMSLQ